MIRINLPYDEAMQFLGLETEESINYFNQRIFKINGLSAVIVSFREYTHSPGWFSDFQHSVDIELQPMRLVVSKEQIDAEEAVKKAKASLEAAELVLKNVKGV